MIRWVRIAALFTAIGCGALVALKGWQGHLMRQGEAENLRQLGEALRLYADDHAGSLPVGVSGDGVLLTNAADVATVTTADQAFRALFAAGIFGGYPRVLESPGVHRWLTNLHVKQSGPYPRRYTAKAFGLKEAGHWLRP